MALADKNKRKKNINDTLRRGIVILANCHISTGILTRIAPALLVNVPVDMRQFARIPMPCSGVSCMALNFPSVVLISGIRLQFKICNRRLK